MLFGSATTERLASSSCEVDNPNSLRFCATTPPFRTLFRYPASVCSALRPRRVRCSRAQAGEPVGKWKFCATYNVTSALAGVPLTGGGTLSVQLITNTIFYDYQNTLDLRLMRGFRLGKLRANALADVYNVFNVGTIAQVNETWGPLWGRPQLILQGRYLRFGTRNLIFDAVGRTAWSSLTDGLTGKVVGTSGGKVKRSARRIVGNQET